MIFDLAIVGVGPAGLSAAVYASRAQLGTVIFGDETRSNLYKSHVIANYLGFPQSLSGPELTEKSLQQALQFGTTHIRTEIVDLKLLDDGTFQLLDSGRNEYLSRMVILATGQSYVLAGIKGEQEYLGKGVSYCVTCDGYFYKNRQVCVAGDGDYAAEEALQLKAYTDRVSILSHGRKFQFNPGYRKELASQNITCLETPRLKELTGAEQLEKIIFAAPLADGNTGLNADGLFIATGLAGAGAFARKLGLEMDGNYIKIDRNGYTNIKGVFAAGDCTGSPAQVAASVGGGCIAALSAIKLLRGLDTYIQYF
jgi:thioredoxin reductase (NADPH)